MHGKRWSALTGNESRSNIFGASCYSTLIQLQNLAAPLLPHKFWGAYKMKRTTVSGMYKTVTNRYIENQMYTGQSRYMHPSVCLRW